MTLSKEELRRINSMTKYPSILTYHKMGEKGKLLDEIQVEFDGPVILTEKIDGTNGRIILFPNGFYIIGSRDELLYAKGDLIENQELGIVNVLKPVAETIYPRTHLTVFYFEVYGGKIGKSGKQYTGEGTIGCRLFDVVYFSKNISDTLKEMPLEQIASWRDRGGQLFYDETLLEIASESIPLTPREGEDYVPKGNVQEVYDWLRSKIQTTHAGLDAGAIGKPEGLVVRSKDRSKIAKIRFEDYERTLRMRGGSVNFPLAQNRPEDSL